MNPTNNKVVQKTYNTVGTVVQGDPQELKQTLDSSSGGGSFILISIILLLVMVSSVIETGTFFGILLPSDVILSISVIAFISLGKRWMVLLITVVSIAFTIVGDNLGYMTGKKLGSGLYDKPDTWYFKKSYFIEAQEAFTKRGDNMLYIGRYLSIGGFLPILCGVMGMDQKKFFRLSVGSATMWKLSLIIPMAVLMFIFPGIKTGLLLVLIFTLPEIVGWIVLFFPKAQEYAQRLEGAKEQIAAIRSDMRHIADQMGSIVTVLKTDPTAQGVVQSPDNQVPLQEEVSVEPAQQPTIVENNPIPTETPQTPPETQYS